MPAQRPVANAAGGRANLNIGQVRQRRKAGPLVGFIGQFREIQASISDTNLRP